MSGSRGTRRPRGSAARNVPPPRTGGNNRGLFPSGEDYVSSAGRGYGSARPNQMQGSDNSGPFSRGNGRRSNDTGPHLNQFPRTDDTTQIDNTSQEEQQNSAGPQQSPGCYNVIAPAEKKRVQLMEQRERNMQLYESVKAANRKKYKESRPAKVGGPKLTKEVLIERLIEEQKKAEVKDKMKAYEQKKKRDAWTEEQRRKEDQEINEKKERARQQNIRNEEKRKQHEMEQRARYDDNRRSHYMQMNAAFETRTKAAAWDSINAYWKKKNGSIPMIPVARRGQSDISIVTKQRRNLDFFQEPFTVQEKFNVHERVCDGTKKIAEQRGSSQTGDYSKQKQLSMPVKTGTRQGDSDSIAEKTRKSFEMKKKRDAYIEEKRRKEDEEIEARKRKAREQAERNQARKRQLEMERKAKYDQERQKVIERKFNQHSSLGTERHPGTSLSKKDTRGLESTIKAWQEGVNKVSTREESPAEDDESEYEDDESEYEDDDEDYGNDDDVEEEGSEQSEEEDEGDEDEEEEADEDDWGTVADSQHTDDASEYFELPQQQQRQQQQQRKQRRQQQHQQVDEEEYDDDSDIEEETEEERKARLDAERRRRNADFFARKFEMDKNVEDIMSDLSSDEDVKDRTKEGSEKVHGRIKNGPLTSVVKQSQVATKEDDIRLLRHTFPDADVELIEELYAQNHQSTDLTISHLSILKQSRKQEVARREDDVIKLCSICPGVDVELIEELYVKNGGSMDETVRALTEEKQYKPRGAVPKEGDISRLRRMFANTDVELIEDVYMQTGCSVDETARSLRVKKQYQPRGAVPKEDDISWLRRLFPNIDVELIEDMHVQTGRSVDKTVSALNDKKQYQPRGAVPKEDDISRLRRIFPGIDVELIEDMYVQTGRSVDKTVSALNDKKQYQPRGAVPKEDDISRLRRMFPGIDVELIGDMYVQTGRSVDKTVSALNDKKQYQLRGAVPKEDDISRLHRMFPDIDLELIEDLYVQSGRSVDETASFLSV